jgi:type IV pilus assembly protein PilW
VIAARTRAAERGVTLTELLVSLVVSAIVCAGALSLLTQQQRAFQTSASDRAMQDSARTAVAELATNLRRAGYGIEPWLAVDLGPVPNALPSVAGAPALVTTGYPGGAPGSALPACNAPVTPADRDSTTGSDEIVFHARDPGFNRRLTSTSTSTLTLASALTSPLYQGQILQVMCGGASRWAYVTVGAFVDVGATAVPLSTACSNRFPHQQDQLGAGCFATGVANARVFKIDRFHYYVARYADPLVGQRPYLMLDRGLLKDGAPVVEPVAADVEDVQFAYVFPRAAPVVVGVTPGTALASSAASIDLGAVPPAYTDPTAAASRQTNSPGNIRAVRVSVVVRSSTPDIRLAPAASSTVPAAANRAEITDAPSGYRRLLVETTEALRNLDSRAPYFPAYSTNAGADGLNIGGG